jgi:NTE family protein
LVLQGGGALGSYQAGVYEALASSEYLPDWVAGISIGAINAAIIVGNTPENRVKRLRTFWEEVTAQPNFLPSAPVGPLAVRRQKSGALTALMFGQPGFFTPRPPKDWVSPGHVVSYYDASVLKTTLERLVDFDRINNAEDMRLSVGAVNVRTGQFSYFDSAKMTILPEHIMASSALPPGFPPVEIDGEYRPVEPQGASKTYDFSRAVMEKRWQQGASDARTMLHTSQWLAPAPKELGVRVFDCAERRFPSKNRQFADACRKPRGF